MNGEKGIHVGVSSFAESLPGIHLNFLLLLIGAIIVCAIAGAVIGLPTLRLRGDYIAIVTLAFGEIIGRFFAQRRRDQDLRRRQALERAPVDLADRPDQPPVFGEFDSATNLGPTTGPSLALVLVVLFVNFRLRDSRLGRAWIALREDEVAAASMGVPLVKTKLLSYATGGAFGGIVGRLPRPLPHQRQREPVRSSASRSSSSRWSSSAGSAAIWGVVLGAVLAQLRQQLADPGRARRRVVTASDARPATSTSPRCRFGVFGFVLVLMMVLRPEGLLPERRRQIELTENAGRGVRVEARRMSATPRPERMSGARATARCSPTDP